MRVGSGLALCEAALVQVEREAIFSPNELAEDVNTGDLKYLLLPFYRGELLLRVLVEAPKRTAMLAEALKCLRGFLADLARLEALAPEAREGWVASGGPLTPAEVRNGKIARMKAGKAARLRMEVLATQLGRRHRAAEEEEGEEEEEGDVDELEREQVLLVLQTCCHTALDSIRATEQELEMLTQMEKLRRPDGSLPPPPPASEDDPSLGLQMLSLLPNQQPGSHPPPTTLYPAVDPAAPVIPLAGGGGGGGGGGLGGSVVRAADTGLARGSRLSYATAMRQIHTGEIPGLYTFTVEEGLRQEEAERALAEAANMQQMGEREEARRRRREEAQIDEGQVSRARASGGPTARPRPRSLV